MSPQACNAALWDQSLGLKWVRDHIGQFGGDPARVTVGGQSAGSYAALFQLASPHSRGLFQRMLCMSGFPLSSSFPTTPPYVALKHANMLAEKLDCTEEQILKCLQGIEANSLAKVGPKIHNEKSIAETKIMKTGWCGVADGGIVDKPFLPVMPEEAYKKLELNNGLEIMMGVTKDEGYFSLKFLMEIIRSAPEAKKIEALSREISALIDKWDTGPGLMLIDKGRLYVYIVRYTFSFQIMGVKHRRTK